ncbi:MAG: MCE family protein [Alphaproteobacteria bacterium]|nr:MCE family protein [Alphaproteobacteria bacterium]
METRANHLLIGSFVLAIMLGTLGFIVWLAKIEIDREFAYYRILFEGAVSGLSVGGDVRFNGILVGKVAEILIDRDNPARVRVLVEIGSETPVRTDTIATLELQGITGVSYVQLSGGSPSSPMLEPKQRGEIPVIPSARSAIQELFAGAPELINRIIILVDRMSQLVDDNNRRAFANTLSNVEKLTSDLTQRGGSIETTLHNIERTTAALPGLIAEVQQLARRLNDIADSAEATLAVARGAIAAVDGTLDGQVRPLIQDLRRSAQNFETAGREFVQLMQENREPLGVFASDGLVEFTRFVQEARQLVATAGRLMEDLQSDPAQFLFGGRGRGGVKTP